MIWANPYRVVSCSPAAIGTGEDRRSTAYSRSWSGSRGSSTHFMSKGARARHIRSAYSRSQPM